MVEMLITRAEIASFSSVAAASRALDTMTPEAKIAASLPSRSLVTLPIA